MATIVQHNESGKRYVLLGTGFGAYKSTMPGFLGRMAPVVDDALLPMVCVCNKRGKIGWYESTEVRVMEVDGRPVGEHLG